MLTFGLLYVPAVPPFVGGDPSQRINKNCGCMFLVECQYDDNKTSYPTVTHVEVRRVWGIMQRAGLGQLSKLSF